MAALPSRVVANAMLPLPGDQLGSQSLLLESASETGASSGAASLRLYTSRLGVDRSLANAIVVPSGDHAGFVSAAWCVKSPSGSAIPIFVMIRRPRAVSR